MPLGIPLELELESDGLLEGDEGGLNEGEELLLTEKLEDEEEGEGEGEGEEDDGEETSHGVVVTRYH